MCVITIATTRSHEAYYFRTNIIGPIPSVGLRKQEYQNGRRSERSSRSGDLTLSGSGDLTLSGSGSLTPSLSEGGGPTLSKSAKPMS